MEKTVAKRPAARAAPCADRPGPRATGAHAPRTGDGAARMPELRPPSRDSILYFIYRRDGDGAATYAIDRGAIVSYWHGHAFDLDGRHYFTAFASKTNDLDDAGSERERAADWMRHGRVAISQATFQRVDGDGRPQWAMLDTDGYLGEFGRHDRAEQVDGSRRPLSHETGDGRLLLAIPTRDFIDGVALQAYALFLFDPDNVDRLRFRRWGYLGSIAAGSDNAAACADAGMPHAVSTGTPTFEPGGQAGLPRIRVALQGQAVASPGEVRALGEADATVYDFDPDSGRYTR